MSGGKQKNTKDDTQRSKECEKNYQNEESHHLRCLCCVCLSVLVCALLCVWVCMRVGIDCFPKDEAQHFRTIRESFMLLFGVYAHAPKSRRTPNKFRSAEHTRYKASGDTSSHMVVNWEKTRITCQLWPNDDSPFSPFFIQKL